MFSPGLSEEWIAEPKQTYSSLVANERGRFECPYCDADFTSTSNVATHVKKSCPTLFPEKKKPKKEHVYMKNEKGRYVRCTMRGSVRVFAQHCVPNRHATPRCFAIISVSQYYIEPFAPLFLEGREKVNSFSTTSFGKSTGHLLSTCEAVVRLEAKSKSQYGPLVM